MYQAIITTGLIAGFILGLTSNGSGETGSVNLVDNAGFEQPEPQGKVTSGLACAPGWTRSCWYVCKSNLSTNNLDAGTMGPDDTVAHTGRQSLRIRYLKGPVSVSLDSRNFGAVPGRIYILTAWMKSDTGEVTALLRFEGSMPEDKHWYKTSAQFTVSREWKRYRFMYELGDHEVLKDVHARIDFWQTQGTLWIDDVSVEQED